MLSIIGQLRICFNHASEDKKVTAAHRFFNITSILLVLSVLGAHAEDKKGGVSSTVTQPAASTAATTTDTKPLPWKFLAAPMGVLPTALGSDPLSGCNTQTPAVPSDKVEELLKETVGDDVVKQLKTRRAQYVVIHVVDPTSGAKGSDAWYLYRSAKGNWGDPRWDCQKFTGQRIYGAPSLLFLFLHLHAKTVGLDGARQQLREALTAAKKASDDTADATNKANDAAAAAAKNPGDATLAAGKKASDDALAAAKKTSDTLLIKGLFQIWSSSPSDSTLNAALKTNALDTGLKAPDIQTLTFCDKTSGDQFQWLGDGGVPSTYANVHYETAVVKRTPANVDNLTTILGLLFGSHAKTNSCVDIDASADATVWGAGQIQNVGLPSDVSIAGYSQAANTPLKDEDRAAKQIGSVGAYNDEQLYYWDASIGIPVHTLKDLQYSSSDNTVVASQVSKQSAYVMFNLMPYPVDLSTPSFNFRLLAGFPLSSSPWDKLFAGGAIGLPWKPFQNFQFFAGATFIRDSKPSTLTPGAPATSAQLLNDLKLQTTPKFTFGINVPVKSVIDKLK